MKNLQPIHLLLATGGLASAMLVGCGGGGSDVAAPTVTPAAETVNVNSTVVDGAIANALVCLDLNSNGACDTGEPSARTDANGNSTLVVAKADAGKFPVIAIVGTDAVDKDHGPVTVAFTMKAPADASAVVSPLTTLVQAHIETSQLSTAAAEAAVKDQLGVSASLLADFTKATDDAGKLAATVARLVVITKQAQVTATAGATGTGGVALTRAQIEAAVNTRLLQLLPSILQAASDPAVQAASSAAAKEAALLAAAQALATEAGLTKDNLGAVVATGTQAGTPDAAADSGAGAALRWFSFTDLNNYVLRAFRTSAAQAVIDANGKRHFDEYRERSINGVHSVWNPDADDNATPWLRNQVYWTGTEWFDCPTNFVHDSTPWSATGESESLYCKAYKSKSKRSARDVAGVKMIDLVKEIRAYPLFDSAGKYANWGPNPNDAAIVTALGEKTFPAGSKLYYVSATPLVNPDAYGTTATDLAKIVPADIATGNAAACANFTAANSASFQSDATTLDEVIARAPGLPCVYAANASTGARNESWGSTTVGIGDLSMAAFEVPSSFYKNDVVRLRAAFGANNTVTYLSCLARASDNAARNCNPIGTGSYSVEVIGDARVLRLANAPASAAGFGYSRILVERGGKVYYGSRDKLATTNQLRLNGGGADALLAALGLN